MCWKLKIHPEIEPRSWGLQSSVLQLDRKASVLCATDIDEYRPGRKYTNIMATWLCLHIQHPRLFVQVCIHKWFSESDDMYTHKYSCWQAVICEVKLYDMNFCKLKRRGQYDIFYQKHWWNLEISSNYYIDDILWKKKNRLQNIFLLSCGPCNRPWDMSRHLAAEAACVLLDVTFRWSMMRRLVVTAGHLQPLQILLLTWGEHANKMHPSYLWMTTSSIDRHRYGILQGFNTLQIDLWEGKIAPDCQYDMTVRSARLSLGNQPTVISWPT